jgi:hypothetical protein
LPKGSLVGSSDGHWTPLIYCPRRRYDTLDAAASGGPVDTRFCSIIQKITRRELVLGVACSACDFMIDLREVEGPEAPLRFIPLSGCAADPIDHEHWPSPFMMRGVPSAPVCVSCTFLCTDTCTTQRPPPQAHIQFLAYISIGGARFSMFF